MANDVTVRISGGQPKLVTANTVEDAFAALNASKPISAYTATINAEPASPSDILQNDDSVIFSTADKHGI